MSLDEVPHRLVGEFEYHASPCVPVCSVALILLLEMVYISERRNGSYEPAVPILRVASHLQEVVSEERLQFVERATVIIRHSICRSEIFLECVRHLEVYVCSPCRSLLIGLIVLICTALTYDLTVEEIECGEVAGGLLVRLHGDLVERHLRVRIVLQERIAVIHGSGGQSSLLVIVLHACFHRLVIVVVIVRHVRVHISDTLNASAIYTISIRLVIREPVAFSVVSVAANYEHDLSSGMFHVQTVVEPCQPASLVAYSHFGSLVRSYVPLRVHKIVSQLVQCCLRISSISISHLSSRHNDDSLSRMLVEPSHHLLKYTHTIAVSIIDKIESFFRTSIVVYVSRQCAIHARTYVQSPHAGIQHIIDACHLLGMSLCLSPVSTFFIVSYSEVNLP